MEIHVHLQVIDFAVVIIYILLLLGIGYWASFIKKKKKGENLFLAGHSLGWVSIGFTMWGTNIGPSMLIASSAIGYTSGIVAGNFSWFAFPFILLLAFVFAPKYLKARTSTLPEFMGKRFNNRSRDILAWYSIVTILISWLGMTLYAGGLLVSQIMNWPLWFSVVFLVALSAFFSITGGLAAVAYTNVFQMILLITVSSLFVVFGITKLDDISSLVSSTPESYWKLFLPLDNKEYPWIAIILGYPVLAIWFWCTDQSMVQSTLGAKNLEQVQLGANLTGWLKILDVPLYFIPGIICFILFPGLKDPNEAYMTMVTRLLPVGMVGLVMAVLIAALISTIASALNSLSTVFTLDIYKKRFNPGASPKETIWIGRVVNLIGAIMAVFITLFISDLKGLDLYSLFQAILGFLAPPMAVVFLLGTLWKKATPFAANFILSAGSLMSFGIGILYLLHIPDAEFWPHFLLLDFYIFSALMLIMVLISVATGSFSRGVAPVSVEITDLKVFKPSKKVIISWSMLLLVMIFLYVYFN